MKLWKKGASRLAFHLSGDVGLRDAGSDFTGIGVCLEVPSNVVGRAKIKMAKTAKEARKSSLSAAEKVILLRRKATCALKGYRAHSRT